MSRGNIIFRRVKRRVTPFEERKIWEDYTKGESIAEITRKNRWGYQTIWKTVDEKRKKVAEEMAGEPVKEAERQHIKELIMNGMKNRRIEAITGRSQSIIGEIRAELGKPAPRGGYKSVSPEEEKEIIRLSDNAWSISAIAFKTGRSRPTVTKIINQEKERRAQERAEEERRATLYAVDIEKEKEEEDEQEHTQEDQTGN